MASLGKYSLYWHSSPRHAAATSKSCSLPGDAGQYVFTSKDPAPLNLRRVNSVPDLFQAFSDGGWPLEKATVAALAVLGGNLLAKQEWLSLFVFAAAGTLTASRECRLGFASVLGLLVVRFFETFLRGEVSLHWLVVVVLAVFSCLILMSAILWATQEDARSYALVKESSSEEVIIENQCCMDVKLLVFDRADTVRFVPYGGLLGGVLLARDSSLRLGNSPAYIVKAYAPFETELGTFLVGRGVHALRQTAPPFQIRSCDEDGCSLSNASEEVARMCICPLGCWTESLWLPMAPFFARLRWGSKLLAPDSQVTLKPPCLLRVYRPSSWLCSFSQLGCCLVRKGESAEYFGAISWKSGHGGFRRPVPKGRPR
eukprot:CAMPEP_0178426090 /NCGR_PEP_ID=MMETSP0689_2-20121128/29057_1 /TAXON_ID=160604 /ORGANISM="Amphidinium massartii, Strain CS-259" /LENGTH=370 /DNA_ID=CAMNT_0020047769 /DNA_START=16 /DNA_END=1124 /DNA_ORIENTATION=+